MENNKYILLRIDPFVWHDTSLNYPEKIILEIIFSFTAQQKCCYVSDAWIANAFGWEDQFVAEIIALLELRGWIIITYDQFGGQRKMSINIPGERNPCEDWTDVEVE
jgi:hypothetical protein